MTRRGMIPRGDWLTGYDTPGRFRKIRITRPNLNQNRKFFNLLVSGPGRFEWWQKWGSKISLDCPFNPTRWEGVIEELYKALHGAARFAKHAKPPVLEKTRWRIYRQQFENNKIIGSVFPRTTETQVSPATDIWETSGPHCPYANCKLVEHHVDFSRWNGITEDDDSTMATLLYKLYRNIVVTNAVGALNRTYQVNSIIYFLLCKK